MLETWKISHWQAMGYLTSTVLATSILFVPGLVAKGAGANSWLSLLFALACGLTVVLLAASLGLRYPRQTVIEYAVDLLGFFPGKLAGFIYVFYFF